MDACKSQLRVRAKSTVPAGRRFWAIPELALHNPPCPQIFGDSSHIQPVAKSVFEADVGRGVVVLVAAGENADRVDPHPVTRAVLPHGAPTRKSTAPISDRECRLLSVKGPVSRMTYPLADNALKNELVDT